MTIIELISELELAREALGDVYQDIEVLVSDDEYSRDPRPRDDHGYFRKDGRGRLVL